MEWGGEWCNPVHPRIKGRDRAIRREDLQKFAKNAIRQLVVGQVKNYDGAVGLQDASQIPCTRFVDLLAQVFQLLQFTIGALQFLDHVVELHA